MKDKAIAKNKKAYFDYEITEQLEAGLVLEGWERKSIVAGKAQLVDGYVIMRNNEAWILGMTIQPLLSASTHVRPDATRTRKLLLHKKELNKLIGLTARQGYTLIPLTMYWKGKFVKIAIGLAKGKKQHDKRAAIKEREWQRSKTRLLKQAK